MDFFWKILSFIGKESKGKKMKGKDRKRQDCYDTRIIFIETRIISEENNVNIYD
jgi:hypothetical protein